MGGPRVERPHQPDELRRDGPAEAVRLQPREGDNQNYAKHNWLDFATRAF